MSRTVAHYIDSDTCGGLEQVVSLILTNLDRNHWNSVLIHHLSPGIAPFVENLAARGIPCRALPRRAHGDQLGMMRAMVRELRHLRPALLHVHLNWPLGCRHGVIAGKLAGIPAIVATSHLYAPIKGARLAAAKQWLQARAIDRYLAVSREVRSRLCGDLGVAEEKVRIVHNGISLPDLTSQPSDALRRDLAEGRDRKLILTPARLHSQKGHAYLLQAAVNVPGALFLLAGEGPERGSLEEQARHLGIEDRVRFLGHRADIPDLMSVCDMVVLPSLFEGLPLSVLEGMSFAKPIVATSAGGTDEAVVDGMTGLLVPPRDPAALAAAINTTLNAPDLASRFGSAGRRRVEQEFSVSRMVRGVTENYEELLAGGKDRRHERDR